VCGQTACIWACKCMCLQIMCICVFVYVCACVYMCVWAHGMAALYCYISHSKFVFAAITAHS
jgi:hypothetical protein